jgi:hypothetical protein
MKKQPATHCATMGLPALCVDKMDNISNFETNGSAQKKIAKYTLT